MKLRERYDAFVIRNTPACSDIVVTHSRALDEFVSPLKRLRIFWHARSCEYCQRYFDQLRFVRSLFTRGAGEPDEPGAAGDEDRLRTRIKARVRDRLDS